MSSGINVTTNNSCWKKYLVGINVVGKMSLEYMSIKNKRRTIGPVDSGNCLGW